MSAIWGQPNGPKGRVNPYPKIFRTGHEARLIVATHLASADPDRDELPARAAGWECDERGKHRLIETIHI